MASKVKISVITRTLDRPFFLGRAAKYLADQTLSNFEWIIVNDGGARDDVVNACADLKVGSGKPKFIHHKTPKGRGYAAQAGLKAAKGEYILLHDDDDWLAPSGLSGLLECIDANAKCVAATCGVQPVTEVLKQGIWKEKRREKTLIHKYPPTLQEIAYRNTILTISTLFRRDTAIAAGGVNPDLDVLEDWDLWLRLFLEGDFALCPNVLAFQSLRPDSAESAQSRRDDHMAALSQIRNHYLREDIKQGRASLGTLLNPHNRSQFDDLSQITHLLKKIKHPLRD